MYKPTVSGNVKNDFNLQRGPNKTPGLEPLFSGEVGYTRMSAVSKHPFADRSGFKNQNYSSSPRTSSEPMSELYDSELQLPMARNILHPSPIARNISQPSMMPRSSSMPWNPPFDPSHTPQNRPRLSQTIQSVPYTSSMKFGHYHEAQMNPMTSPQNIRVQEYFPPIMPGPARALPLMMGVPQLPNQLMQHQMVSKMTTGYSQDARFCPYPQQLSDQKFGMHSTKANSPLLSSDANKASATARSGKASASAKTNKNGSLVANNHRFFMGTIEQVVRWYKMAKEAKLHIIYKTAGVLESMTRGGKWGEYVMVLRDTAEREEGQRRGGPSPLQLVFYPIDRELPTGVVTGQLVTCVGRMTGENKMQVLAMEPATRESLIGLKRISFLCQWAMQEAVAANEP